MKKTEQLRETALAEGRRLARKMFAKRGNNSEVHLDEVTLACALTVAFELGYELASKEREP